MRTQRAEELGGQVELHSSPDGTRLTVTLPCTGLEEAAREAEDHDGEADRGREGAR